MAASASASASPSAFAAGLRAAAPIAAGYFPVAFSFALTALQAGLAGWQAVLISIVVYAGAAQFVLVALMAAGGTPAGIVLSIALLNLRHLFYGPALLTAVGHRHTTTSPWLLGAGLTDEVFGTALGRAANVPEPDRERWLLGLQLGAYAAWVGGTATGALVGLQAVAQVRWLNDVFAFVLPALFFTLLLDAWQAGTARTTILATLAWTALLLVWLPAHAAIVLGMLGGAAWHALWPALAGRTAVAR